MLLTVKNTGSYTFSTVSYQIYQGGSSQDNSQNMSLPTGGLGPGQSDSNTSSFNSITGSQKTVGDIYTIVVTGVYGNGQTYTVSTNVVAS